MHLNYAYGGNATFLSDVAFCSLSNFTGATTNNSLIRANSPDTGEQMQTFLADPDYDPETKKPLVSPNTSHSVPVSTA